MRCRHHTKTSHIKYLPQNEGIFRRIKENIPGDRGRIGVRTMCHTRWTIKVVASMSSIISNGTLLRSTRDDVKDVDRARYGYEGKNSRHYNATDHTERTRPTAETRQRIELNSGQQVALMRLWRCPKEPGAMSNY